MRLMRTLGAVGALIVAALVGGTLINAVAASPEGGEGVLTDEDGEYCDLYLDTLAEELGVEPDALVPATRSAATSTIEAMVDNGDLPAEIGERMTSRIAEAEGDGCALLGARFHGAARHAATAEFRSGMWQAAAETLGLEPADLHERLADGASLSEVADEQGVEYATVSEAVLSSAQADLDAAVAADKMTQERADRALERISGWLDDGGQPRGVRGRH
ncbi:MAG: hypothetical protein ACRDGV_12295 [Candidatus Limnocylindria bacterium]